MSTLSAAPLTVDLGAVDWKSFPGNRVIVLYASEQDLRAAQALARDADALIESLIRLVPPQDETPVSQIHIYLLPPAQSSSYSADGSADRTDGTGRANLWNTADLVIPVGSPPVDNARLLTQRYLRQTCGENGCSAATFVEGIAGMAAAQAGIGPPIEDADEWVRSELDSGRPINLGGPPENEHGRSAQADQFNSGSVSFLAFLAAHSGSGALRRYLTSFDPDRRDQAAIVAYRQPLPVLQEEWLGRMHRRPSDRAMLQSFLRQVMPLLAPYKWKQLEILCYLSLAAGYNIVQPYAIKTVIDRLTREVRLHPGGTATGQVFTQALAPFLLLLLGIYVLNGIVSLRRAYTVSWLNQNILNTLQIRMYAHLQRLAHNFHIKSKTGDIMARLNDDLDTVQSALSQVTNKALYQGFTVIGALTALLMITRKSPLLSVPILCIVPLFAVSYAALRTRNKRASREQRRGVGQAMAGVQQNLAAHAVIKAFGLEQTTIANYEARIQALRKSKLRLALLSALTDLSEDTTTALAQLVIFGVGGYLVLRDGNRGLGVGDLSALLVLVKSIFSPIASLAGIGQTMQQATGAMERVTELFDEPVTIQDKQGAVKLDPLSREIRLEDVTFRYGGQRPAIANISATLPAGAFVTIVGLSGGGKSSLVNLLMRFWDPEEGRVLFDGTDLRDATLASIRGQIGLVFQETFIFDTTLRENIALGRPAATDAEVVAAAKAAQLDEHIRSLPDGYDTIPGENGARLSVGQKQRIAIARVFLRDPRILILDEATSALDAQTEAGVLDTLAHLAKGRTTISVTHRVTQARSADLILVMGSGRLVEQGTHDDLLRAEGLYKRLYDEAVGQVGESPNRAGNTAESGNVKNSEEQS